METTSLRTRYLYHEVMPKLIYLQPLSLHQLYILHMLSAIPQHGGTQQSVLLSMPEVHGRLLDILALLLSRGVDPTVPDSEGNTPSGKASTITTREECFLDGAVLLGEWVNGCCREHNIV